MLLVVREFSPAGPLLGALCMKIYHTLSGSPYDRRPTFMANVSLTPMVHAARFASTIFVGLYVLFLWLTVRLMTRDPWLRLAARKWGPLSLR